ncbi:SH3 domain-containing protein [Halovulum sp. GXIMD14794]
MRRGARPLIAALAALLSMAAAAPAQQEGAPGPVTNLPIPRYVSIKTSEANVRRGPSLSHRIDWVFQRRHLPVQITAEYGHWRRVRDIEGAGGWVHYSLLSGARYVLVTEDQAALRRRPDPDAQPVARAEAGVVARLGDCEREWCEITADRLTGWVRKSDLWGVDPDEIRD